MEHKLIQKHFLKGIQEIEIIDDAVNINLKPRFGKEESLTVMLTVLNPEPIISKSMLEFTSRVNNEPLLSLFLAKPNAEEFNRFVSSLKQKIQDEYNAFAGLKAGSAPATPAELEGNVFEEPPEFDDEGPSTQQKAIQKPVRVEDLQEAIRMIADYIGGDDVEPLLSALKSLHDDPKNAGKMAKVVDEFNSLGPKQGAVLTYAPYVGILMSDDPFSGY